MIGGVGQAALQFCKELQERREAKEYWEDKNHGADWRHKTKYTNPLLTAINVEVQRFNSKMILERQPHQINLIEPAFVKCKIEVERKKKEASKSLKEISQGILPDQLNLLCKGSSKSKSAEEGRLLLDGSPAPRSHLRKKKKRPPDPPRVNSNSENTLVHSDISDVEHSLAIKLNLNNSRIVSTPRNIFTVVPNGTIKGAARIAKVSPSERLYTAPTKDPTAMHWEPPNNN